MSRHSHLPPRCPLQNTCLRTRSLDSSDLFSQADDQFQPELFRYPSMDSLLEEDPSWLDDLLSDSDGSPQERRHRRSSSDSVAVSKDSIYDGRSMNGSGLENNFVYGPNSPRQIDRLSNSRNEIVNSLLEKVPGKKLQDAEIFDGRRIHYTCHDEEASVEPEPEKSSRRRSGQRSRVRKLQYISYLQQTVEALQDLGAELAAKVASLFQHRVALSLENKSLRQQISILRHEKILKEGEHQLLKIEAERLKMVPGRHRRSKSISTPSFFEPGLRENFRLGADWQSLDFRKLSLG